MIAVTGDMAEFASAHGQGATDGIAVNIAVAGHAAMFVQPGKRRLAAQRDDPGAGGNHGRLVEPGRLVAVEIGAAVMNARQNLDPGRRP